MKFKTNFNILPRSSTQWTDAQVAQVRGGGTKLLPGGGKLAIVSLGGGYTQASLDAFADASGMPRFTVKDVSVDGVTNNSGDESQDASVEVLLDIQRSVGRYFQETGKIPEVTVLWHSDITPIVEYFADHPELYTALSCSWGSDERNFGAQEIAAYAVQSARAVANKQTIVAASGDNSSSDGDVGANVDFPSSDADTVAAGGTSKQHGDPDVVWGNGRANGEGTGGGYSSFVKRPAWQTGTNPMRMTPDIVEIADPNTGWPVYISGGVQIVGGTSASAPSLAGLFAAIGPAVGNVLPAAWANPSAFIEVTSGSNGQWTAGPGVTPCTGLGTVNTPAFIIALGGATVAPVNPTPVTPPVQRTGIIKRLFGWLGGLLGALDTRYQHAMNDARERDIQTPI